MVPPTSNVQAATKTLTARTAGVAGRTAVAALLILLGGSPLGVDGHLHQQKQRPNVFASTAGRAEEQAQPTTTLPPPNPRDVSLLALDHRSKGNVGGGGFGGDGGSDGGSSILIRRGPRNHHERNRKLARTPNRELSSTGDGSGDCSDEFTACGGDSVCLSCVNEHVNMNECVETYHASGSDGTTEDAGEMTLCQSLATSFCCGAYDVYIADAVSCVDDGLVMEYWTCSLESNGCSVDDLPCYGVDLSVLLESEREAELEEDSTTTDSETSSGQASTADSGGDMTSVANGADANGTTRRAPLGLVKAGAGGVFIMTSLVSYLGALGLSVMDGL